MTVPGTLEEKGFDVCIYCSAATRGVQCNVRRGLVRWGWPTRNAERIYKIIWTLPCRRCCVISDKCVDSSTVN